MSLERSRHFEVRGLTALMACLLPLSLPAASAWYWNGQSGSSDWCAALNWNGRAVPESGDTAIFREYDSVTTNVDLTCDTTVARVRQSANAITPRVVRIGPGEMFDRTLTINGAAEALVNDNVGTGNDLTFSGQPNTNGYRLKMRVNSFDPWLVQTTTSSLILNCDVSGPGGVNKTGVGTLILNGDNSFSGNNTIAAGRVNLGHPRALGFGGYNAGAGNPNTIVGNITTLDLGGQTNINESLILNGVGLGFLGGALINSSNTLANLAGGVVSSLSVSTGGAGYSYPVTVTISGGGGTGATATATLGLTTESITLLNGGIGYSSAPKVYFFGGGGSGAQAVASVDPVTTAVNGITVTASGSGYTTAPLVILNGGDGVEAQAIANSDHGTIVGTSMLTGGGGYATAPTVSFSGGGGASATANLASVTLATDTTIGGNGPISIESVVLGTGALIKSGSGSLALSGTNTYSGGTSVRGGTLLVNNLSGSGTGSGFVTVTNGGSLVGTGIITGPVTVVAGGSVGGGSSVGRLTLAGGLNLTGGGTNVWELIALKDDTTGTPGTDFDQILISGGALDLSGNSQLLLKFAGAATAPYSTEPFWQTNHTWTILAVSPPGTNPTNLPFAKVVNGIYNAGSFSSQVGSGGTVLLSYTANAPSKPVITSQPQGVTTNWNRTATFKVTAVGADPEVYQWYFQDSAGAIPGATNTSLVKTNLQAADTGNYFVIITNGYGSATSDLVALTVVVTPPAPIQPLLGGGTTNVVVRWGSVAGATYQLQYNTNLSFTNWFLISNVVATGTTSTVEHRRLKIDPQRYYRVIGQ